MSGKIRYIKIARIDSNEVDITDSLESLSTLVIPSGSSSLTYQINNKTRYPSYYLFLVTPPTNTNISTAITSSVPYKARTIPTSNNGIAAIQYSAMPVSLGNISVDNLNLVKSATSNINPGAGDLNYFDPQTDMQGKQLHVSLIGSASVNGNTGQGFLSIRKGTLDDFNAGAGSSTNIAGTPINPNATSSFNLSTTTTLELGQILYLLVNENINNFNATNINFTFNTILNISSSQATGSSKRELTIEPFFTSPFYKTDCDVTYGNASQPVSNPFLQDIDYGDGIITPTNNIAIISGTAARGTIPESYYTALSQTRIRYTGVKNQSEKINVYPPNGKSFTLEENFFQSSPITGIASNNRISSIASTSEPAIVAGTGAGLFGGFNVDSNLDSAYFKVVEANNFPSWGSGTMTKTNVLELNPTLLQSLAKDYSNVQIYFNISAEVDVTDGNSSNAAAKLQVGLFSFTSGSGVNVIPRAGEIITSNGANSYYVSTQNAPLQNDTLNQQVSLVGTLPISAVTNNRKYLGLAISSFYTGTDATRYDFSNVSVNLSLQGIPLNIGTFGQTSPIDSLDASIYEFEWGGGTTPEILNYGAVKLGKILQVSSKDLVKTVNAGDNARTIIIPSKRGTTSGRARNYRVIAGNPPGTQYPPGSVNTSSVDGVHFWDTPQNIGDYYQILNGNNPVNTEILMFMYPNSTAGSNPTLPSTTKILTTEWGVPSKSNYALTSSNSVAYGSINSGASPRRFISLDRSVHISKVTTDSNGFYQSAANPIKPNWATIGDQINHDLNEGEKWFVTIYNEFEFPEGAEDYNSPLTSGSLSPFNTGVTINADGNYSNALAYKGVYEIAGVYDNFSDSFNILTYEDFPDFGGIKNIGGNVPGNSLGMLIWKARGAGKNEFVIVQDEISGGVQGGAFTNRYAPNYLTENFEAITKEYGGNQTG